MFNTLVFMSGITAAIPYALLRAGPDQVAAAWTTASVHTPRFARDVTVAVVGLVFSVLFIVYSRNTGEDTLLEEYLPVHLRRRARSCWASRSTSLSAPA